MSVMRNLVNIESIKFWIKGICDAVTSINKRTEEAHKKYDDLFDKFTRYTVISNEIEGRQSQLISISTTFGYETQNDPVVREFLFNNGAILRYARTLSPKHTDPLEVVNYRTLINVVTQHVGQQQVEDGQKYLGKNGDTATGTYIFNAGANGSGSVTYNISALFNSPARFTKTLKCIDPVADDEALTLGYLKKNIASLVTNADAPQPIFASGKIAFAEGMTTGNASAYNIEKIKINNEDYIFVKLLSYSQNIGDCKSWTTRFGNTPHKSIPGNATGGSVIPSPTNFSLIMEYNDNIDGVAALGQGQVFRVAIPNQITTEDSILKWTACISKAGDLCLLMKASGNIKIPTVSGDVDFSASLHLMRFYLIVDAWSYLPYASKYVDADVGFSLTPKMIGPGSVSFCGKAPFSELYKGAIYYQNFPVGTPTFSSNDSRVSVIEPDDAINTLDLSFSFPAHTILPASFTAVISAHIDGTFIASCSILVKLSSDQLEIVPVPINVEYSDYLDAFPLSPNPKPFARQKVKNSSGEIVWALESASNCSASIIPTTGKIVLYSITTKGQASIQISAKDQRYYQASGTFSSTNGEVLTISGADMTKLLNEKILINNVAYDVLEVEGNTVTIDPVLPQASHTNTPFSVEITSGKAIAVVPVVLVNVD